MSKSKSKSKSKSLDFPANSWAPNYEVYTYFPALFEHIDAINGIRLPEPQRSGDELARELEDLIALQGQRNTEAFRNRREDIVSEADHISRKYLNALLISPESHPRTWFLMNAMNDVALVPVMQLKKHFMRPRPNQVDPRVEPLIMVPGHPAYPSGHSTQNFLIAHALSEVIGDDAELIARVFAIARGVAVNREWAGVHYHSDTDAGEKLARGLYPIVRRVFKEPIREAILEWQEISLEEVAEERLAREQQYKAQQKAPQSPYPDSLFHEQWHLQNTGQGDGERGVDINVREAWSGLGLWPTASSPDSTSQKLNPPVRVILLDMAVDLEHESLTGSIDLDHAENLDYPEVPRAPASEYVAAFGGASSAHGTACAGIIVANNNAGKGGGVLGIAPTSKVVPLRAMTLTEPVLQKRQVLAQSILGIFANGFERPQRTGDILLCPLPFDPLDGHQADPLAFALAFVATKIPVILPSGNNGSSQLSYLAAPGHVEDYAKEHGTLQKLAELLGLTAEQTQARLGLKDDKGLNGLYYRLQNEGGLITVGACNNKGYRSRYSQYGDGLDLVAPSDDAQPSNPSADAGKGPTSTLGTLSIATTDIAGIGGYNQDQSLYTLSTNEFGFGGTSAAAAQVAGVVALMLTKNSSLKPVEVRQTLRNTATIVKLRTDSGAPPERSSSEFGYGLVDAAAAVG